MVVGLTGGMGSGKTTVLKMFKKLGASIYIADYEAKQLMFSSNRLKENIRNAFGEESYIDGELNTKYLSKIVFADAEKLKLLNSFVHPTVYKHFKAFVANSTTEYIVYESAILMESEIEKLCDYTVVVTAPVAVRLDRIKQRDTLSKEEIIERLQYQKSSEAMIAKADFVIENIDLETTKKEVLKIHNLVMNNL